MGLTSNTCPWVCASGFYYPTSASANVLARSACVLCTNAPALAAFTGPGSTLGDCPWQCTAGSYLSGGVCSLCPEGTYLETTGQLEERQN